MAKCRPSGDGMVRKRDDGHWEGRIVVGHKENGNSIFRYIYADTQKELTTKLRQSIDIYQGIDLTEQSRMTLSEWLDQWLEQMAVTFRPSTLEHYRKDMENHVKPYLGSKLLTQLTSADLRKLYDTLKQTGRVKPRPGQGRGKQTLPPTVPVSPKKSYLRLVPFSRKLTALFVGSGYRLAVLSLICLAYQNKGGTFMKNAKSATLLLTGAVLGAALTSPTANAAEAFFQAQSALSPIYVDGRQVRFHDLRHGFATNALAYGMDVKTLSMILGHTSGNTTLNIYTHATDAMRKTAAEKIDRGIAKAEPKQEAESAVEQLSVFQPTSCLLF